MPRPIKAQINLAAMKHNLSVFKQALPADKNVWAVVKANAYGHGIEQACQGFAEADGLAMLDIQEAKKCREYGWKKPILLLEGIFEPADLDRVQQYDLTISIHQTRQIEWIKQAVIHHPIRVAIKVNSGMNRLGFTHANLSQAYTEIKQLEQLGKVSSIGVITHFARADEKCLEHAKKQLSTFQEMIAGFDWDWISCCNSAASLQLPEAVSLGQWVRAGISLYGSNALAYDETDWLKVQAAMNLDAQIIAIQDVCSGQAIGYSGLFVTKRASRIAVIACGYADGYPRVIGKGANVRILKGGVAPIVGRVSMDMMTIDVTDLPQVKEGDWVRLWGQGGPSIDEVAQQAGTLGYELMCALAKRVPVEVITKE
ncbi:alanine racemase [Basilea psittacipulmonis]|uniref:Alanine racemase n=1 Tax=Basilea psittacipulmonis DSM 24701 TaxID=1072685 RepID=A0A077DD80_9BURK|nr:alanine racemase [Basilea psittacipulmonis]AIL32790.1 hypothetical protein IX83_05210 [Basilea psittacipulmonis DSM 24701]